VGGGGFYGLDKPAVPGSTGAKGDVIVGQRIKTDTAVDLTNKKAGGARIADAFEDSERGRAIRRDIRSQMRDAGDQAARTLGRKPSDAEIDVWFRDYMGHQIDRIAPKADVVKWRNPDGTFTYVVRRPSALVGTPTIVGQMVSGRFVAVSQPEPPPEPSRISKAPDEADNGANRLRVKPNVGQQAAMAQATAGSKVLGTQAEVTMAVGALAVLAYVAGPAVVGLVAGEGTEGATTGATVSSRFAAVAGNPTALRVIAVATATAEELRENQAAAEAAQTALDAAEKVMERTSSAVLREH